MEARISWTYPFFIVLVLKTCNVLNNLHNSELSQREEKFLKIESKLEKKKERNSELSCDITRK